MKHFLYGAIGIYSFWLFGVRIHNRFYHGKLKLTFFDVGQGDSTLIQFPKGSTMLIDAGRGFRKWDIGKAVLVRELGIRSILTLDTLLMTHPDQDHSFGLRGILSELKVGEFWMSRVFLNDPNRTLKERLDLVEAKKVKLVPVEGDVTKNLDGVETRFIALHAGPKTNNNCLVTVVRFGECSGLLVGDIEEKAERELLKYVGRVDILKIAHHGSKTSSSESFLKKAEPKVGVISSGMKNTYGHPHMVVLKRLKKSEMQIFRTDFHGMTEFESDGKEWVCRTTLGECGKFKCGE